MMLKSLSKEISLYLQLKLGRFKGKRVIFLKSLSSGLLLITGPYNVNGVPIRRVNQAYVISTSTKLDITDINLEKFDDNYFSNSNKENIKRSSGKSFSDLKRNQLPKSYLDYQIDMDNAMSAEIEKIPQLRGYLSSRFSLKT